MSDSNMPFQQDSSDFEKEGINREKEIFEAEVKKFRLDRVSKLRAINHWWNLSLTVAGITFTLLATVLGVVENDQLKGWIKFGIGVSGAASVASQSANSEFRVRRKAGEYTLVEAEFIVLEHQTSYVKNSAELEALRNTYYSLLRRTAEAEAASEQD